MYHHLVRISRRRKKAILATVDFVACVVAFFSVEALSPIPTESMVAMLAFTLLTGILASLLTGTNRIILRSLGTTDLKWMLLHALILQMGYTLALKLVGGGILLSKTILFGCAFGTFVITTRIAMLSVLDTIRRSSLPHSRVAIYGAGLVGQQLSAALHTSEEARPIAFFDDNLSLQGAMIDGVMVHASTKISRFIKQHRIDKVIVAIPSISDERRTVLRQRLDQVRVPILELPPYNELVMSGNLLRSLRPVQTADLLNREAVKINMGDLKNAYTGKNIFVSGAGGSIGSELCRQIIHADPARIVLLEICEFALYSIDMELRRHPNAYRTEIIPVLGSVHDRIKLKYELKKHEIQTVLHAAAYKHVPLVESNAVEAGRNNILGTQILASEAAAYGVERFIFVSTDKAVRPTNVMGATKRFAELVVQDLQTRSEKTKFSIVRFGNVLGSSGSVIPLFKRQIDEGGPITVTDPNITRYFMTISEAAHLVLMAGSLARGGEVFVLDMGKPLKIDDLARKLVKLVGLRVKSEMDPEGDIEIIYTGLRPGEKMYEELFEDTCFSATPHRKIMRAMEAGKSEIEIASALRQIHLAVENIDKKAFVDVLEDMVEGFGKPRSRRDLKLLVPTLRDQ